jgi:hypothetical protein
MIMTEENRNARRLRYLSVASSTRKPTWSVLVLKRVPTQISDKLVIEKH